MGKARGPHSFTGRLCPHDLSTMGPRTKLSGHGRSFTIWCSMVQETPVESPRFSGSGSAWQHDRCPLGMLFCRKLKWRHHVWSGGHRRRNTFSGGLVHAVSPTPRGLGAFSGTNPTPNCQFVPTPNWLHVGPPHFAPTPPILPLESSPVRTPPELIPNTHQVCAFFCSHSEYRIKHTPALCIFLLTQ